MNIVAVAPAPAMIAMMKPLIIFLFIVSSPLIDAESWKENL